MASRYTPGSTSQPSSKFPREALVFLDNPDPAGASGRYLADLLYHGLVPVDQVLQSPLTTDVVGPTRAGTDTSTTTIARPTRLDAAPPTRHTADLATPLLADHGVYAGSRGGGGAATYRSPPLGVAHAPAHSSSASVHPGFHEGSYALPDYGAQSGTSSHWKNQYYTARMTFNQIIPSHLGGGYSSSGVNIHKVSISMLIDTGSNTTWTAGHYHRRLLRFGYNGQADDATPALNDATKVSLIEPGGHLVCMWTQAPIARWDQRPTVWKTQGRGILNTGYTSTVSLRNGRTVETIDVHRTILGSIHYMAGTRALLALESSPSGVNFSRMYDWGARSWANNGRVSIEFRSGVAYAVDYATTCTQFLGVLGLGPENTQKGFPGQNINTAPSFLNALISQDSTMPVDTSEGGVVLIFGLRLPRTGPIGTEYAPSWMAINRWPCSNQPQWSSPLATFPGPFRNQDEREWNLYVERITVFKLHTRTNQYRPVCNYTDGFRVLLDTGFSVSYLPRAFLNKLEYALSGTIVLTVNSDSETHLDNSVKPRFTVPPSVDSSHFQIEFAFRGTNGRAVVVPIPIDPFVYTRRVPTGPQPMSYANAGYQRDSLLWESDAKLGIFVLGLVRLNFFGLGKIHHGIPRLTVCRYRISSKPCLWLCTSPIRRLTGSLHNRLYGSHLNTPLRLPLSLYLLLLE
ncbi:hypothetical protein C8Q78DRAFT_307650 [Trametes maxima]|nr:hypothetical protein C8Q78DRAFT_307650 [Trametes maxima]